MSGGESILDGVVLLEGMKGFFASEVVNRLKVLTTIVFDQAVACGEGYVEVEGEQVVFGAAAGVEGVLPQVGDVEAVK